MSDRDQAKSFSDLLDAQVQSSKNSDDIYDLKNFGEGKRESRLSVKWTRIKKTLFGEAGVSGKFVQGMIMGATVGGVAGTLFGLASYLQHRRLIYVPIIAMSMAISFGFFMGVGTVIRTDDTPMFVSSAYMIGGKIYITGPEWQEKYKVRT